MSHVLPSVRSAADASIHPRSFDHPDSVRLLRAYAEERREMVGFDDPPDLDKPYEYEPPSGLFVVAYSPSGAAIACGGYRTYRAQTNVAEVRKMYVAPGSRRLGLSRRVLQELEHHAAGSGAVRMILETGSYNHAATRLYASAGYESIPPYVAGRPAFNRAYAKQLSAAQTRKDE
ncbi:GNAT family N-acetyltransferase [Nocardia sp. CY41]|uniref:GNAT family N-acetyltransferase n=1 Tax=Nocardia sp. CY41 TaxID=2608686 RepID=UPI001359C19A|nr:GNAT family N-acetyltransferase [Nocardia sp. CY41]